MTRKPAKKPTRPKPRIKRVKPQSWTTPKDIHFVEAAKPKKVSLCMRLVDWLRKPLGWGP